MLDLRPFACLPGTPSTPPAVGGDLRALLVWRG